MLVNELRGSLFSTWILERDTFTRLTISCMILTDDVCLASLAQLTSLVIDNLFPTPRRTPLHVPVPPTPPKFCTGPAFGGLKVSKFGVFARLSEIGGDGGV